MKDAGRLNYQQTIYASYVGYITQAAVNNFAPLLFLHFSGIFSLSLDKVTLITTLNFAVQLVVDLLSAHFVDRIGYRISIMAAHAFAACGLAGLAVFPFLFENAYAGVLHAVVLYAIGGGLIEVLISPIVEGCPTSAKEAAMSLLHSFYCWGHVGVVVLTTLFFRIFGIEHWRVMAVLWAIIPLANMIWFAFVPLYPLKAEAEGGKGHTLFKDKLFWIFMLLMLCAGASEQGMSQWASAFAEKGLGVSKTVGDLLGPCAFAVCMGSARAFYGKRGEKIPLRKMIAACAVLCIVSYVIAILPGVLQGTGAVMGLFGCALCGLSVGIFWPGTFSMAAKGLPAGGTAMFAYLALAGDLGCSLGPTIVGLTANAAGGNLSVGLIGAILFPVLILLVMLHCRELKSNS